jgi:hypothetical protein
MEKDIIDRKNIDKVCKSYELKIIQLRMGR